MDPFVGEIRGFAFGNLPDGWFPCDGRLLPIEKFVQLFSLIGNQYGGDGMHEFAVPDLRGAAAVHSDRRELHPGNPIHVGDVIHSEGAAVPTIAVTYAIAHNGVYPQRD